MSKHHSSKRRLKYVFMALACTASFSLTGLAAACTPPEDKEEDKKPAREDTQLLKNGNFEFFTVPEKEKDGNEPVYLINSPTNWTRGGTSPYTMTGIIGTSDKAWGVMSDPELAGKLDFNNELDSSSANYKNDYIDYNGMKSSDIPYRDTWAALNESKIEDWESHFGITTEQGKYYIGEGDDKTEVYCKTEGEGDDEERTFYFDEQLTRPISKQIIDNPGTHYDVKEDKDGYYYMDGDKRVKVYADEKGDYYLAYDEDKDEYSEPISHVLMLHNYATTHNGLAQSYTSVTVDLPANTAAEVSLWVKTTDLMFNQGEKVTQDRGANISVSHTVGGSTLADFTISCINTQKLIDEGFATDDYNGWVEYTVYVNACDFAASTISIKLGLGESDYAVEGYAFFDDVKVTKFVDLEREGCSYDKEVVDKAVWTLSDDVSEKVFKADSYKRNNGNVKDHRFAGNFHYLLDLASEDTYKQVTFGSDNDIIKNLKTGLTQDADKYVSSTNLSGIKLVGFPSVEGLGKDYKLPDSLKNLKVDGVSGVGLDTRKDLLAHVKAGYSFKGSETEYAENLNTALKDVVQLPKINNFGAEDDNVLVMLSANGAAYTSSFELAVAGDDYQIISFWVKTSDMEGGTAATVKVSDTDNKDNSANVALDTKGIVTDIDDDNKDIYNGWVQCFFFVHNDTNEDKQIKVEFSFGNTAIKDTTVTSYKAGWVALANMQALSVNEETFGYTGSGSYTASLTLKEEEEKKTSVFDEVYGSQSHDITEGLVNASSYNGVNGGSSFVKNNGHVSIPYDNINTNPNAGLLNREYAGNYEKTDWYKALMNGFGVNVDVNYSDTQALANWTKVFGAQSVQPLVIINDGDRESYVEIKTANKDNFKYYYIKNEQGNFEAVNTLDNPEFDEEETYYAIKHVLNYGFIGKDSTVSADSYQTVSVKVKVSAGAVAYIYLVDTDATENVLGFSAPSYSFYYDIDGNVLKDEHDPDAPLKDQRENVLYTLRDDGLYEDKNGNLFANLYNYTKLYYDQQADYYNADGKRVNFDDLKLGETYWLSADAANKKDESKQVNHYLTNSAGKKLYEYKDGKHYYIVDGKTQETVINKFDTQYARYDYSELDEQYKFVLDARYDVNGKFMTDSTAGVAGYDKNGNKVAGEWFTVNFVLHAGSAEKKYRLELWSGERESELTSDGATTGAKGSSVIFDYSYTSVKDDTLRNEYENEIVKAYQSLLSSKGLLANPSSTENISYYEKLVKQYIEENKLSESDITGILNNYKAHYYTFSLYDSGSFQPFNKETADENATGYDYNVEDYKETLAYLEMKDGNTYSVFADYSTVDKSITLGTDTDTDTDEGEDENKEDNSSVWLLVSSILLVIALLFTMLSIFVKDSLKKARRNKAYGKNAYNRSKANRYIRKYGIAKEEIEEDEAQPSEDNAEEVTETEVTDSAETENVPEVTEETEVTDENNSEE